MATPKKQDEAAPATANSDNAASPPPEPVDTPPTDTQFQPIAPGTQPNDGQMKKILIILVLLIAVGAGLRYTKRRFEDNQDQKQQAAQTATNKDSTGASFDKVRGSHYSFEVPAGAERTDLETSDTTKEQYSLKIAGNNMTVFVFVQKAPEANADIAPGLVADALAARFAGKPGYAEASSGEIQVPNAKKAYQREIKYGEDSTTYITKTALSTDSNYVIALEVAYPSSQEANNRTLANQILDSLRMEFPNSP